VLYEETYVQTEVLYEETYDQTEVLYEETYDLVEVSHEDTYDDKLKQFGEDKSCAIRLSENYAVCITLDA
jgi:hypothetical protein